MTEQEIQELARHRKVPSWVIKLVADAVAVEREACAKVCDELETCSDAEFYGHEFANAIRARGQDCLNAQATILKLQSEVEQWRDIHDAVVKDADKAHELLRWAETEMRYAWWGTRIHDQHGRTDVYEAIVEFLK